MNRYVLAAIVLAWPLAGQLSELSTSTLSWFTTPGGARDVPPSEASTVRAGVRALILPAGKQSNDDGRPNGADSTPRLSQGRSDAQKEASTIPAGSAIAADGAAAATTEPLAAGAVGASLSNAGDAGMQDFCASGGAGIGYDAASDRYDATCGNHAWSDSYGGTIAAGEADGRVAAWNDATTPGGNAYRIDCTGPGVGTTQDGNTVDVRTNLAQGGGIASGGSVTSVESAAAGYAPDALRGYLLVMLSGPAAPSQRQILGNDADTITVHADSALPAAPGPGDLYAIYNPFPSNCYDAGEVVILNFMADAMLAQDLTKPGGTIYFPDLSDGKATIYVHTGCGRKAMNLGTTPFVGNHCPVLRGHNDHHYQRHLNMGYANVTWNFGPPDYDLMSEFDGRGRSGVYVVNDTGGAADANEYYDPADQVLLNVVAGRSITTGSSTFLNKACIPISTTDPRCDVTSNDPLQSGFQLYHYYRAAWSDRADTLVNDTDTTDPQAICVNNSATSMGVCEDDPRVVCTEPGNAERTGPVTGGCQFGAAPENDIGPCVSPVDAIAAWNDTRPDRFQQWVTIAQRVEEFPGTTFSSTVDATFARVWNVPHEACGGAETAGATLSISGSGTGVSEDGQWTLPIHRLAPHDEGQATLGWLDPSWNSPNGGVVGGTFTPNGWWGRDVDADGESDPWDCLSGSDADTDDDEAGCDTASVVSFGAVRIAGWQGSVIALGTHDTNNGAGSWFDASDYQNRNRLYDVVIKRGKRGRVADWTDIDTRNLLVEDNSCWGPGGWASCMSLGFNSRNEYSGITLRQNSGANIIGSPTFARQIKLRDIDLIGNSAINGQIDIAGGGGWTLEDIQCSGGTWPCIMLTNYFSSVTNVSIHGVRVFGQTVAANVPAFTGARSAIDFTRFYDTPVHLLRNVSIEDVRVESGVSNTVLVSFDDDPASETSEINVGRATVSIRDSSIDCIAGASGCIAIGVGDHAAGGGAFFDATDDNGCGGAGCGAGIWAETYMPIWTNLRVDGVAIADNPLPTIAAADAGDCDAMPQGTLVRIRDDTAIGACTDSSGLLQGGGGAVSTCECDGQGRWKRSTGGVTSAGGSSVGSIPTFSDTEATEVVDSGATIVDGVLTLAPSTVRPSEIRYLEDADFGSSYVSTQAASAGTNLTGDIKLILTRVSRALAAASGPRGPVVGAVSNGGTFDTPEGLCDLAYYAANGVVQSCVAGTAKKFDPSTGAPTWIGCSQKVAGGIYFEVVCNVE